MKYKLKLDYTADELQELKKLSRAYNSPMIVVWRVARAVYCNSPLRNLHAKYIAIEHEDEFDFMADINNVVMGTAIFPEKKYVVHDSTTNQYIYYSVKKCGLFWGQLEAVIPYKNTKEEWLKINPAYEPMLERVEDNE